MKRIFCLAALACFAFTVPAHASPIAKRHTSLAHRHMIVTANPYASQAGLEMLRAGGSAVDAAIAAQAVLGLVEPQSSGIGGGSFMLLAEKSGVLAGYDGREMAPASANPRMFLDAAGKPRPFMDAVVGGLSVGVPGNIAMLAKAHAAHGRLPWARLFGPAIKLATNGFKVPPRLAAELRSEHGVSDMPGTRALYFHADGTPVAEGEVLKNPAYAETLRQIAHGGAGAFYVGRIADAIVAAVTNAPRNPTVMTRADLADYRVLDRTPLCGAYRRYRVCSMPPPAGGVVVLQILALVRHLPSAQLLPDTLSEIHLVSEAQRLAYVDRARWLGDPAFVAVPTLGLLDAAYIAARVKLIDPARDMGTAAPGAPPMRQTFDYAPQRTPVGTGTSHLSAIDDRGEVVSMTTTIESPFGSRVTAGGFILNNQLTDFSFDPMLDGRPVANAAAAGKRPLSAMSPTIIFDAHGKFFAAIGSPGGRNIIAYVTQAIMALIDGHTTMPAAVRLPHHVNQNGDTRLEQGTGLEALAPQLTAMGHTVSFVELESGLNGIRRVKGGYEGGADPRRDGVALGD